MGFSQYVDGVLGDNAQFLAIALAVLGAHIALAIASIVKRRTVRAMCALNLALACMVVLYLVTRMGSHAALIQEVRDGVDGSSVPIIACELVAAGAAMAAFARVRFAVRLSWFAYGLHGVVSAAVTAFALMFKWPTLM